jgi:hypothetical protein
MFQAVLSLYDLDPFNTGSPSVPSSPGQVCYPFGNPSSCLQHVAKFVLLSEGARCLSDGSYLDLTKGSPCTGLDRPLGLQEVEAPRFQYSRHFKVVDSQPYTPAAFTPRR